MDYRKSKKQIPRSTPHRLGICVWLYQGFSSGEIFVYFWALDPKKAPSQHVLERRGIWYKILATLFNIRPEKTPPVPVKYWFLRCVTGFLVNKFSRATSRIQILTRKYRNLLWWYIYKLNNTYGSLESKRIHVRFLKLACRFLLNGYAAISSDQVTF